jgi:hypothetical protein
MPVDKLKQVNPNRLTFFQRDKKSVLKHRTKEGKTIVSVPAV